MARENFFDSLRFASQLLAKPAVQFDSMSGFKIERRLEPNFNSADLWLTPKAVDGFDVGDFSDWTKGDREKLAKKVAAFLDVARQAPANKPATKSQSQRARKHLEQIIEIVRTHVLNEWVAAQTKMEDEVAEAAKAEGWYVERDEKELQESLLGKYKSPRLRIITKNKEKEVLLDPIARFGSGRRGVVDLVTMPTYETAYLVTFKGGAWQIVSLSGTLHSRPFSQQTFIKTIASLSKR